MPLLLIHNILERWELRCIHIFTLFTVKRNSWHDRSVYLDGLLIECVFQFHSYVKAKQRKKSMYFMCCHLNDYIGSSLLYLDVSFWQPTCNKRFWQYSFPWNEFEVHFFERFRRFVVLSDFMPLHVHLHWLFCHI